MATVDEVTKAALKKYDLPIGSLGAIAEDVRAYSTGNIAIDDLTGVIGLPAGRSIELYGPHASGKTTCAIQTAVSLQQLIKAGGNTDLAAGPLVGPDDKIFYLDYEHAMDPVYVARLGLDVKHPSFLFCQPSTLEQGANVAKAMVETGEVRMFVWDSIPGAIPSSKAEAEIGKSLPAVAAKLYADFLGPMNDVLHRNNCTAIYINHLAEVMGMGQRPGMPPLTTTPGGRALKFYASVRIEFRPMGQIKEKKIDPLTREEFEQVVATNVKVKVVKNKVGPPMRQAMVRVRYGLGFDNFWTAMQILIAHKKIVYSSGYFYFEKSPELIYEDMARQKTGTKRPYVHTEKKLFEAAVTRPDWRALVIAAAREALDALGEPEFLEPEDLTIEVEDSDGVEVKVNPETGEIIPDEELISEDELDRLTSFIPKETAYLGADKALSEIIANPPSEPETKVSSEDFTQSLLAELDT